MKEEKSIVQFRDMSEYYILFILYTAFLTHLIYIKLIINI